MKSEISDLRKLKINWMRVKKNSNLIQNEDWAKKSEDK